MKFLRLDSTAAQRRRDLVELVYRRSYVDAIAGGDAFTQPAAFMERFDAYAQIPGLDLLIGYAGGEPIGQTWGWPLTAATKWWTGLEPAGDFDIQETGSRTFALSEIMVAKTHTGKGFACALHNRLLSHRTEQRATLLVDPSNDLAAQRYQRWGWRKVGQLQPSWDHAPRLDALVTELPMADKSGAQV